MERVEAYKALDGQIYETEEEAEVADAKFALYKLVDDKLSSESDRESVVLFILANARALFKICNKLDI